MNDDRLLRDLARLADEDEAAERARFDRRWDALSAGTLTADEVEALRARAAESEESAAAYDLFRPFDAEFRARLVARLGEEMRPPGSGQTGGRNGAGVRARTASRHRAAPRRRRHRRSWWPLAAAAVLVVALGVLRLSPPVSGLPPYSLSSQGGLQDHRGEADAPAAALRLTPGIGFTLLLTPQREVDGEVAVRAFAVRGESWRPWPAAAKMAQIAPSGAVRIAGRYGRDLELPAGEWTLLLVVARPEALPGWEEVRATPDPGTGDWWLLRQSVEIVESPRAP